MFLWRKLFTISISSKTYFISIFLSLGTSFLGQSKFERIWTCLNLFEFAFGSNLNRPTWDCSGGPSVSLHPHLFSDRACAHQLRAAAGRIPPLSTVREPPDSLHPRGRWSDPPSPLLPAASSFKRSRPSPPCPVFPPLLCLLSDQGYQGAVTALDLKPLQPSPSLPRPSEQRLWARSCCLDLSLTSPLVHRCCRCKHLGLGR
jgi:hypothetical protein